MGWDENEKFVLDKLEFLETNLKESDEERREEHRRLYTYVQDVDERLDGKMDKVRDDLLEAIGKGDQIKDVSRLKAIQAVIGSTVVTLLGLIAYFHFGLKFF